MPEPRPAKSGTRVPVTLVLEIDGDLNVAQIVQAVVENLPGTELISTPELYVMIEAVEPPNAR